MKRSRSLEQEKEEEKPSRSKLGRISKVSLGLIVVGMAFVTYGLSGGLGEITTALRWLLMGVVILVFLGALIAYHSNSSSIEGWRSRRKKAKAAGAKPGKTETASEPRKRNWGGALVKSALVLVLILIIVGITRWSMGGSEARSLPFTPIFVEPKNGEPIYETHVARPMQPVVGVMPENWGVRAWADPSKFDTTTGMDGFKKLRIFNTKPGVAEAEVTLYIFPCTKKTPCVKPW